MVNQSRRMNHLLWTPLEGPSIPGGPCPSSFDGGGGNHLDYVQTGVSRSFPAFPAPGIIPEAPQGRFLPLPLHSGMQLRDGERKTIK